MTYIMNVKNILLGFLLIISQVAESKIHLKSSEGGYRPLKISNNQLSILNIQKVELTIYDKPSYEAGGSADDFLRVNFNAGGNNGIDSGDAPKFFNPDENFARNVNGEYISIERRDLPQIDEILPLFSTGYANTEYVFVAKLTNLPFYNVFLYDNYTNMPYLLDKNFETIINFAVDPNIAGSVATNRFEFRFNSIDCDPTLSTNVDSDSDNITDFCDLDDDNDGILDLNEIPSEPSADRDGDGIPVSLDDNDDDDTIGNVDNAVESGFDTDGDGLFDHLSLDSDNDGCSDANEYHENANADGNADGSDDSRFGDSGTLSINDFGLVIGANYDGNGLSDSKNDAVSIGCRFLQTLDGNWNDPTRWREGIAPTFENDVALATDVQSIVTQNQTVKSLTLTQGTAELTSIDIADGFIVSVKENLENNGEFFGDGEVLLDGTENQDLSGTGDYENLRVNNPNGVDVLNTVLTDPTEINGVLYLDDGNFTTNDNVLFPCFFAELGLVGSGDFANGRAGQIGPIGADVTIIGNVRVEQCFPGRRAYRFVSASTNTTTSIQDNWQENATAYNNIPVLSTTQENGIPYGFGTHITGLGDVSGSGHSPTDPSTSDQKGGLDWQPSGNPSMFEFNEGSQTFNPVLVTQSVADDASGTETATLTAGKAYSMIIRGSREVILTTNASPTSNTKLRSTGTVLKGHTYNSNVDENDFMFIGNPFHSTVDMRKVVYGSDGLLGGSGSAADNPGLNRYIYAYDPTLGGNANDYNDTSVLEGDRGAFVTIDLQEEFNSVTTADGQPTNSEMSHFLQVYQGFFIQAIQNNPTMVFEETDKAVDQEQIDVFSKSSLNKVSITLYDQDSYSNNSTSDDFTSIIFNQNYNNGIDYDDALKFTNQDENLGRLENNSYLTYESRAMPQIDEVLELYTSNYRTTDYIFIVEVNGLLNNSVYLYDNYTNTETLLNNDASTAISFSVDAASPESLATDRFEIRFETSTLGSTEFDLRDISVYPNPSDDILNIDLGNNTGRFESLELYDINGRLVSTRNISNQVFDVQMNVSNLSSGVYVLKVNSDTDQFSSKVIIK